MHYHWERREKYLVVRAELLTSATTDYDIVKKVTLMIWGQTTLFLTEQNNFIFQIVLF